MLREAKWTYWPDRSEGLRRSVSETWQPPAAKLSAFGFALSSLNCAVFGYRYTAVYV